MTSKRADEYAKNKLRKAYWRTHYVLNGVAGVTEWTELPDPPAPVPDGAFMTEYVCSQIKY